MPRPGFYVSDTEHARAMSTRCRPSITCGPRSCSTASRNWEFLAPQTEEEAGEGRGTVALEVRNSRDILFANYPRLPRDPLAPAGAGGGQALQFDRHSFPQRACQRRERFLDMRRQWLRAPICARASTLIENAIQDVTTRAWRCASASSRCWTSTMRLPGGGAAPSSPVQREGKLADGFLLARRRRGGRRTASSTSSTGSSSASMAGRRSDGLSIVTR